jgi:hypothetical protein
MTHSAKDFIFTKFGRTGRVKATKMDAHLLGLSNELLIEIARKVRQALM